MPPSYYLLYSLEFYLLHCQYKLKNIVLYKDLMNKLIIRKFINILKELIMKNKKSWLIIFIGMVMAFLYIFISCVFYTRFNEALTEISKYQVNIMKSGLSIQKLIIISCLFIIFITIFFISVFVNMGVKAQSYECTIGMLHSEIVNAEIQNHRKELESEEIQLKNREKIEYVQSILKDVENRGRNVIENMQGSNDKVAQNIQEEFNNMVSGLEEAFNKLDMFMDKNCK